MTDSKWNEESKDQLWKLVTSANKQAADKVGALAEIQAVIDSYLCDIAGDSPSPSNEVGVKSARRILGVFEDLRDVEHTDKDTRRLFYKILAERSGVLPGDRTVRGKKLFRSMRKELLEAGKATLSESKKTVGRPVLSPQLIDAMVALAHIWKKFAGKDFKGSRKNPYSDKGISKKGMSARFVALAMKFGAGVMIPGSTEHAFNKVKRGLKKSPATSVAAGSVSASGSGSGSSSGGEE